MSLQSKKVLFLLPHQNFRDKELTWTIERLDSAGISYEIASDHLSDAEGQFGTIAKPDVLFNFVSYSDYDAFVVIGENAADTLVGNNDIIRIIQGANTTHKVIGAIGHAVRILGLTNVVSRKRISGPSSLRHEIEASGGYFSTHITEVDENILTANGPYSTREFTNNLITAIKQENTLNSGFGRVYLR